MKKGLPEPGDLVVVTIKSVKNFGANAKLEEYPNCEGFVHIAEVATGWVRHIKDYLREGQKTVCKVLSVDSSRNYAELSLKRVNEHQKREKVSEWKNDQRADKLLEIVSKSLKKSVEASRKEFADDLANRFGSLYEAFEDASASADEWLPDVQGKWKETFVKVAKENVVLPYLKIGGVVEAYSLESDGVERIRNTFKDSVEENVRIQYAGAPRYNIVVTEKDYKSAEDVLKRVVQKITDNSKKYNVVTEFTRR